MTWRNYEHHLNQRFEATVGTFQQKGYSNDPIFYNFMDMNGNFPELEVELWSGGGEYVLTMVRMKKTLCSFRVLRDASNEKTNHFARNVSGIAQWWRNFGIC